ncbi:hypothetical protein GCM10022217_25180 [Chryseobacterium ginsenosidimutans]|uniref:DUF7660 family protein n=1 Tax=Chryseobacterium ginsenosidimutans TaxID=687846 RepID=UPI0031DBF82E
MQDFKKVIEELKTKDDFIIFVELLIKDLKNNSQEWSNNTLNEYLEGIASWTEDMEGYYINNNIPVPEDINWKVFANILIAAKMYE